MSKYDLWFPTKSTCSSGIFSAPSTMSFVPDTNRTILINVFTMRYVTHEAFSSSCLRMMNSIPTTGRSSTKNSKNIIAAINVLISYSF